ncbi:MAG: DNA-directed RNA polymerase subunit G [Fervidicoccaceae archaeon]
MTNFTIDSLNVASINPSIIPQIVDVKASAPGGIEVLFEYHKSMGISYSEGEKLLLKISSQKIPPTESLSFCGKATLFSIKQKEGGLVYLFSIGGLILRISSPGQIEGLEITKDYYFCIEKTSQ